MEVIQLSYKEKKTPEQLIKNVFEENGITFNLMPKEEAKTYLQDRNYYYKLACYRKNFHKKNNKYFNLDFQHLVNISKIDKEIRYLILQMCLDIEHALKTCILKDISYNDDVDGYAIVHDFISSYNAKKPSDSKPITINTFIDRGKKHNSSTFGIYEKVTSNNGYIAIWQLIEIMQFNEFERFFKYYYDRFPDKNIDTKAISSLLVSTRYIRNAASHNSPLLVNLAVYPPDLISSSGRHNRRFINRLLYDNFKSAMIPLPVYTTYRFMDFSAVFKLYKMFVLKSDIKEKVLIEFKTILTKHSSNTLDNELYPNKNNDLSLFLKCLKKIFDNILT